MNIHRSNGHCSNNTSARFRPAFVDSTERSASHCCLSSFRVAGRLNAKPSAYQPPPASVLRRGQPSIGILVPERGLGPLHTPRVVSALPHSIRSAQPAALLRVEGRVVTSQTDDASVARQRRPSNNESVPEFVLQPRRTAVVDDVPCQLSMEPPDVEWGPCGNATRGRFERRRRPHNPTEDRAANRQSLPVRR